MSTATGIEWTDATWNPVRGCSRVSEGCRNCYAERQAIRQAGPGQAYHGLVGTVNGHPAWTGLVRFVPELLAQPLRWKAPRRVFVNSMSDLFHEGLSDAAILEIFRVMYTARQHTYQVLTKRPDRMREFCRRLGSEDGVLFLDHLLGGMAPALDHVWLGVSVEDQATADARIPLLLETPAAVRFVSYEPALGPVDFWRWLRRTAFGIIGQPRLDWLIVGGESGPGARPFDLALARTVVEQGRAAGVPVFVKQLGAKPHETTLSDMTPDARTPFHRDDPKLVEALGDYLDALYWHRLRDRKGGDPSEWPADLRVREFPR